MATCHAARRALHLAKCFLGASIETMGREESGRTCPREMRVLPDTLLFKEKHKGLRGAALKGVTWTALSLLVGAGAMDVYLLEAAVAVIVLSTAWWLFLRGKSGSKKHRLPPGPKPWPLVGNLPSLGKSRRLETDFWNLASQYGPLVWLKLGAGRAVLVSSAELARAVLKEQDTLFSSRPRPQFAARELLYIGDEISYAPYGPFWRFSRKVFMVELMTQKRLQQFKPIRDSELDAMVKSVGHVAALGGEQSIDMPLLLHCVLLNTLTRIAVGTRFFVMPGEIPGDPSTSPKAVAGADELYSVVVKNLIKYLTSTRMIGDVIPGLAFLDAIFNRAQSKRVKDTFASTDAFLQRVVDEHRLHRKQHPEQEQPRDVLDVLLTLPDTSAAETGGGPVELSDRRLKAFCLSMIVAGADTSSSAVEWVLAELLRQPEHLDRVREELDRVVGRHRPVDEADLPNLPFLRAVIKESWRMHPFSAILFPRVCTRDTQLAGYDIPANTTVLVNVHGIAHDPAVWPDPHRFLPQRFLDRPDVDVRGQHFELLPFGSGRRACPGLTLGLTLVEVTLARLLHSFNWSLPGDLKSRPQDLSMESADGRLNWRLHPLMAVPSLPTPAGRGFLPSLYS